MTDTPKRAELRSLFKKHIHTVGDGWWHPNTSDTAFIDDILAWHEQEIAEAKQQGWHEGRYSANNPEMLYSFRGNESNLQEALRTKAPSQLKGEKE